MPDRSSDCVNANSLPALTTGVSGMGEIAYGSRSLSEDSVSILSNILSDKIMIRSGTKSTKFRKNI